MKTAVLIHGAHLLADGWETIVWGEPRNGVYGRAPAGLREALRFDADTIFFSTGASQKDGILEGEMTLKFARERIREIPEFSHLSEPEARAWLDARAVLELTSQVTRDELTKCATIARSRGVERLILVSSPTHIMRAHQTAITEFSKDANLRPLLHALYAVSSDTPYAGATVEDVVIIEPPHRPDRPQIPFYKTIKGLIPFMERSDVGEDLNKKLDDVIQRYNSKL